MILKDLVDTISSLLQEKNEEIYSNIEQWIFDAKVDMLRVHKFECMRADITIPAAGVSEYLLPVNFGEVLKVVVNGLIIPNKYSNVANSVYQWIKNGIDVDGAIQAVSSSAADVNSALSSKKVIAYEDENSSESISLNGTTPVDGARLFTDIKFAYKDETAGTVDIRDSLGTVLVTLPARKLSWLIQSIAFSEDLAAGQDIVIRYSRHVNKLTADYDADEMQIQYPGLIIEYCLYRGFMWQDNVPAAQLHLQTYNAELMKAKSADNRNRLRTAALDFNRKRDG
jgi:hypothetical protein